jgi:hypothetical protein
LTHVPSLRKRLAPAVRRLGRASAALGRDEGGASLIEFALFTPILATMALGISDVAMGYSEKLTLEAAAYRALEKVAVGSVQTDYSALRAEVATAAEVPASAVTVDNWLECDSVRNEEFDGACAEGEQIARYVQVNVDWHYVPQFNYGPLARGIAQDGVVPIHVSTSLRIQ